MKSITVTSHRAINYGAVFQSLALHKTQLELGIDNYLLEYPKDELLSYPNVRSNNLSLRRKLIDIYLFFSTLLHIKQRKKLFSSFDEFISENIKTIGSGVYSDYKTNPPIADLYFCGSDQVFDPRQRGIQYIRNLSFTNIDAFRFSYAASLSKYDLTDNDKRIFYEVLNKFTAISVREISAKNILQDLCKKEISVNIDPVFLFDKEKWSSFSKEPRVKGKYILCFPLLSNNNMQYLLKKLKKKYNCKTVVVSTNLLKTVKADEYIFDASPEEFLGLIKNAEAVVTTSFHGTALATVFEKDFYCLVKEYKPQRMTDLLSLLGLSDRIVKNTEDIDCILLSQDIDFSYCREKIMIERQKALDYLRKCIETAKGKN